MGQLVIYICPPVFRDNKCGSRDIDDTWLKTTINTNNHAKDERTFSLNNLCFICFHKSFSDLFFVCFNYAFVLLVLYPKLVSNPLPPSPFSCISNNIN